MTVKAKHKITSLSRSVVFVLICNVCKTKYPRALQFQQLFKHTHTSSVSVHWMYKFLYSITLNSLPPIEHKDLRAPFRHAFSLTLLHEHAWVWLAAPIKRFISQWRGLSRLALCPCITTCPLSSTSLHSYSKSAVKTFRLIFANHHETTKVTTSSSLSSISNDTDRTWLSVLQRGYKCFFLCVYVCHLCDLFAVVLEALFESCAPGCGLWCCWLLKRGWFSTGDRCSVT